MTTSVHLDAQQRITAHFDEFAPEYHDVAFSGAGMTHLSQLDLDNIRRAAALALAARTPGTAVRACDVGVGTGRISRTLIDLGFEVTGVDASAGMLAQAAPRLVGADLRLGSLSERLPVDDGSADLVTCLRVVKYLPEWRAAIGELARVARPGGMVCFDLANAHSPARFGYPEGMVWPTTHAEAVEAIDAVGLELVATVAGVHVPDPVWRRASSPPSARIVATVESALGATLRRHGARSWTFIARRLPDPS